MRLWHSLCTSLNKKKIYRWKELQVLSIRTFHSMFAKKKKTMKNMDMNRLLTKLKTSIELPPVPSIMIPFLNRMYIFLYWVAWTICNTLMLVNESLTLNTLRVRAWLPYVLCYTYLIYVVTSAYYITIIVRYLWHACTHYGFLLCVRRTSILIYRAACVGTQAVKARLLLLLFLVSWMW